MGQLVGSESLHIIRAIYSSEVRFTVFYPFDFQAVDLLDYLLDFNLCVRQGPTGKQNLGITLD